MKNSIEISIEISIYDLEGSVKNLIEELKLYPDDSIISVCEEPVYKFGGYTDETERYLKITWKK